MTTREKNTVWRERWRSLFWRCNNHQVSCTAAKTSRTLCLPPSLSPSVSLCLFLSLLYLLLLSSLTPTLFRCTPFLLHSFAHLFPLCNSNVTTSYTFRLQLTASLCLLTRIPNVWNKLSTSSRFTIIIMSVNRQPPLFRLLFYIVTISSTQFPAIQSSVSTSVSSSDLCYLSHGGASETFTINEAVPIGSIVGSLKVSSLVINSKANKPLNRNWTWKRKKSCF